MSEGIIARIKFTGWLVLFSTPILAGMWSQRLDQQIAKASYLPALSPLSLDFEEPADQSPAEADDDLSSVIFPNQEQGF